MKKRRFIVMLTLSTLLLTAAQSANAQFFEKLKDTVMQSITGEDQAPDKDASTTSAMTDVYEFTVEVRVKMTTSEDNQTFELAYLLNPDARYMAITANMGTHNNAEVGGDSIIVMDNDNVRIFVDAGDMKMQMSSQMMGDKIMHNPSEQMADYDYSKVVKTGNTKIILGETCNEYVMSDKDAKINLWVAPNIDLPNWFLQNTDVLKGYVLGYAVTSSDGSMTGEVISIDKSFRKTLDSKDYPKMF